LLTASALFAAGAEQQQESLVRGTALALSTDATLLPTPRICKQPSDGICDRVAAHLLAPNVVSRFRIIT
jgi:hypothetical protein